MGWGHLDCRLWAQNVFKAIVRRGLCSARAHLPGRTMPSSLQLGQPAVVAAAGYPWKLCFWLRRMGNLVDLKALSLRRLLAPAASSFLHERLAGSRPQALSPGQAAVLPFPRPKAPQAWLGLHRLSQSPVAEEPQGHRASASGSAVSEVTGGTPVLCKYRGLHGRRAGWLQPSIILARRGGGQTRHRAPGSKPVCFPFVSCVSAGCDRLPVSSCLAPSPGRMGEGRKLERLPPRHPFRTSKAPLALSVPAGSGPENVIRGGQCRAGPASALRAHWGPWIPPFAASTTLVTAPLPRASLLALLSPGIPAGQPSPAALLLGLFTTASHLSRGMETPRTWGAASLRPFMSSARI